MSACKLWGTSGDQTCNEERSTTPASLPEGDNKFEDHHGSGKRKVIKDESNGGSAENGKEAKSG